MAGRGRGRGGGLSFNVEQLGFGAGEVLPGPVLQPPPLYPPLENTCVGLDLGIEGEYLLALKRDFVEYLHDSPAFLQQTVIKNDIERYSDRYQTAAIASRPTDQLVCDWKYLPVELQLKSNTKTSKKRKRTGSSKQPKKILRKAEDITHRLEELEKKEEQGSDGEGDVEGGDVEGDGSVRKENKEDKEEKDADSEAEEDADVEDEDLDEEMDDGTDYINNYFDNGEDYVDDEDDNLDDGPIY